jgi:hypothetical protein
MTNDLQPPHAANETFEAKRANACTVQSRQKTRRPVHPLQSANEQPDDHEGPAALHTTLEV